MANQYVFLPWLRRGLAQRIAESDPLISAAVTGQRPTVPVKVNILADDVIKSNVSQEITLLGPGDIVGINRQAIVKTEPAAGTRHFEPNFFPYIEFYEEDFLWRYSPAKAAGDRRLRPWLALIVLQEPEFERVQARASTTNRIIRLLQDPAGLLPVPSQTWAWAHVQVNDGQLLQNELADPASRHQKLATVLNANPNLGVSRLLCPRKLAPRTIYYAFLIPAFERGRVAGLGGKKADIEAVGRFEPAWGTTGANDSQNLFPVYYEWSFQTGEEDFEALAKKIVPRDLTGTDIGRLWMDASDINYGGQFDYRGNLEPDNPARQGFLPFEGALTLPGPPGPNITHRPGQGEKEFVDHFAKLINLGVQYRQKTKAELQWSIEALGNEDDDPLLVPPIYGRWYARPDGEATVNPALPGNWLEQLNLDPALRVAAGLGAEVIREHQEEYMSRSWEQLADNRRQLNTALQRLRFSQEVTKATYEKHFARQTDPSETSKILALTHSIHPFVRSDQAEFTVAGKLAGARTDAAFVQPAYRRLTRSNGPVMKRVKTPTTYANVVMSGTTEFTVLAFFMILDPPFQNFNSWQVQQFDSAKFIFQPGPWPNAAINLHKPNWFGERLSFFLVDRMKLPGIIKELQDHALPKPQLMMPPAFDLHMFSEQVLAKIQPATSFKRLVQAMIPENAAALMGSNEVISPNSFNPFFSDPMFERLGQLRPELFIPNLEKIGTDSFVLLQANSAFIEAYLVGLNHELGAEFLWRGFPADLNATFFRQFWDVSDRPVTRFDYSDINPIRFWEPTQSLGTNGPFGKVANPLVFVIKAGLIKRYPNLVVYAQPAKLNPDGTREPDKAAAPLLPIFRSTLDPDYLFAGFDLTKQAVLGQEAGNKAGMYFVLAERPGEMHFGLDQSRLKPAASWNDLAWTDLPTGVNYLDLNQHIPAVGFDKKGLEWGKGELPVTADPTAGTGDAAQMAAILQQRPVQIFIHASLLVQ